MTNLLPLESWRQAIGYSPWHFWGLSGNLVPVTSQCNSLVSKWSWQAADAVGREDIKAAIATAEDRLREYLGYSVAPHYVTEEITWPGLTLGSDLRRLAVKLREGLIQAAGTELLTSIGTANVTYTDDDGDGLKETFTATIVTSETDPARLAAYFSAADRLQGAAVGPEWRIEPVSISIAGGTATIKGHAWLLVRPVLYEGVGKTPIDPGDATKFVTTLDIYRRTTDSSVQATLTWESPPWPAWCCASPAAGTSTDPAAIGTAVARVGIRDARVGLVTPAAAVYDASSGTWSGTWPTSCRPPDRVTVSYLAGAPPANGATDRAWQPIVARLAAAELARRICACEAANRELFTWQQDLTRTGSGSELFATSRDILDNPFGQRRGHVYAWRAVKNLRHLSGYLP